VAAPDTAVITGLDDIAGDSCIIRRNGTLAATATGDQGLGNFGNYPIYIGHRGGVAEPLNGLIYSLIIRGAASTPQEVDDTEAWVADKTGVTLP
jgi:hypothetical protein